MARGLLCRPLSARPLWLRQLKATCVVIDSLSGFHLVLAPTLREDFREALARTVSALTSTGVTVLMTSELADRDTEWRFSPDATAFLTDAIIVPGYTDLESRLQPMKAALKIRACAHSSGLRLFHDDDEGVKIDQMQSNCLVPLGY
jgi:circadian clock protein KaiC